jgi:hypothetical protein
MSLAMAERGLDQWDAVLANLREGLEIYINLGNRETIARTFNDALFLGWSLPGSNRNSTARAYLPSGEC